MTIYELSDLIESDLVFTRYSNQGQRHSCQLEGCEFKDGVEDGFISSFYGSGESPDKALKDFVEGIRGKLLVKNAMSKDTRIELKVPTTLE